MTNDRKASEILYRLSRQCTDTDMRAKLARASNWLRTDRDDFYLNRAAICVEVGTADMTRDEILTAIEAEQMIQQRNPPSSEEWLEASANITALIKLLGSNRSMIDSTGRVRGL